ncbi:MAG: ABC transporter transmembrane domain-containing protein, partial [Tissierellia bacterium]|nr:ABC transporter transmembrane domain-containing protein [Tissierellia bacterium]
MKEYIKDKKLKFFLSAILMLTISVGSLYAIYARSEAVNLLLAGDLGVFRVIYLMLGVIAATEILKVFLGINNASILKAWNLKLGEKIADNIVHMGYDNFYKQDIGQYISWYTGDLPLVNSYVFNNTLVVVNHLSLSITSLILLFIIHWKLLLFSLILILLLLFFGTRFGEKISLAYQDYALLNGKFNNTLQEYLGGYSLLKNFKCLSLLAEKVEADQEELEGQMYYIKKFTAIANLGFEGMKHLFEGAMFIFTTYLVVNNELSLGMLVATPFILGIFLTSSFSILEVIVQYKGGKNLMNKMVDVEYQDRGTYPALENDIRLDEISFNYGEKAILKDVDFTFDKNQKYAIIGESGSG